MNNFKPNNTGMDGNRAGTLHIVATPIGNLEDITLRALKVLKLVDIIAAENVEHTKGLCKHYGIETRVTAYNQHNRKTKAAKLVRQIKSGQDAALVTDAGTPGISDPGVYLVSLAAGTGIVVIPIPGPSAVIAALSVSGMPSEQFLFLGFLPNKSGKRKKSLAGLTSEPRTMVFFEAPHRIRAMLCDLRDVLGDRKMALLREITKVFEDVKRGSVSEALKYLTPEKTRGEFTLVVEGKAEKRGQPLSREVLNRIEDLLSEKNQSVRNIAECLSNENGISYRQVYKECLARKKDLEKIGTNGTG